tara:strand:+ start:9003 stop:10193 length:1191 start_codon:yes stop_codon:yes gene_type:complete
MESQINKKQSLDDLIKFLSIEGITGQEKNIAKSVEQDLLNAGIPKEYIAYDNADGKIPLPTEVGNLIVKLPGTIKSERIMFSCHMDTVPLCKGAVPLIKDNKIIPKGNTALGGDNRTGVASLVTMLKTLFLNNIPHLPITVLFTVREESGLWGARKVEMKDLDSPKRGYNIDGGPVGEIVIGAVGCDRWEAEIFGKAEHAGLSPEKGISSTMIASLALADAQKKGWFGKIDKNGKFGTSNVGIFGGKDGNSSGKSPNTVTDYTYIKGETRSYDQDFVSEITDAYEKSFNDVCNSYSNSEGDKPKLIFKRHTDYYSFNLDTSEKVISLAKEKLSTLGLDSKEVKISGGFDANWLVKKDIPTITYGAGHNLCHTVNEYIEIEDYYNACKLSLLLAQEG